MAKRVPEDQMRAIETAAGHHPDGATASQIAGELGTTLPVRTLQHRLKLLVVQKRLLKEGKGRWAKYRMPEVAAIGQVIEGEAKAKMAAEQFVPLSASGAEIQAYVRRPLEGRTPVGYNREFLDSYQPDVSSYLSPGVREHLRKIGKPTRSELPAGTYAKQILSRLLIDLSWNSSRLEGNTYSLLDTKRLIDFGEEAEGKERLDAQMILNHKDAIEFLVGASEDIGFNRYTILNLHAMLANFLLADPAAAGSLRHIAIGIDGSVYHPLEAPQIIEECFDQVMAKAARISDPFEQSFFVMVQLPYLQAFDDVNKRVARLAANIPFIKANLSPLSFVDVPRSIYTDAMLGIYELNRVDLLKDVFVWAYGRSAARYTAIRQSLGEPDPFRLRHRIGLREIVGQIIRDCMDRKSAAAYLNTWTQENIEPAERNRFREIVENELLALHEGNFARYQVKPSEFKAWLRVWAGATDQRRPA